MSAYDIHIQLTVKVLAKKNKWFFSEYNVVPLVNIQWIGFASVVRASTLKIAYFQLQIENAAQSFASVVYSEYQLHGKSCKSLPSKLQVICWVFQLCSALKNSIFLLGLLIL